jgi:regulatory protein
MPNEKDHRPAMEAALFLLKFRGRSEKELTGRLVRKGFPAPVAARVVARLKELSLVDDAALARDWVRAFRRAGAGEIRARRTLTQRGLGRAAVEAALAEPAEDVLSEKERALAAARRRWGRLASLPRPARYRRLGAFLGRRGFSSDVIHDVLNELIAHPSESEEFHDQDR